MMRPSKWRLLRYVLTLLVLLVALPGTVRPTDTTGKTTTVEGARKHRDIVDDNVKILFCTSCGFAQNFEEVKKFVEDRYPHLVDRVYGANYEPEMLKKVRD